MTGASAKTRLLVEKWERLQRAGFIGPGPVEALLRHADGFRLVAEGALGGPPSRAADLGTGVGIPGVALALAWPGSRWWLVESNQRRAGLAEDLVRALGLGERVEVLSDRVESVGRDPARRGRADLVVSRLFGAPAVVAECATPLLRVGGHLVVSEPPDEDPSRWPPEATGLLGLAVRRVDIAAGARFAALEQVEPTPQRYPRRPGIPAKRPLW